MKRSRSVTGVLLLLMAGSTWGQGAGNQPRMVLQALDTDHDGKLSAAEIQQATQSLMTLDRNGDGQLTVDELQPKPENAGASPDELLKQLMSFDKNGDGVLTPDELPARMQSLFERGDANKDGKLTPDEIKSMAGKQGMPAGNQGQDGQRTGMMRTDPILNALDADHDGVLSTAEVANAKQALLTLDKNGDGEITADEMRPRQQSPADRADHMLDEWDTNKDGKISKAEAPDRMQAQFETIDKNGDGFLDKNELVQYFATQIPMNGRMAGPRPEGANAAQPTPKEQKQ